MINNSLNKKKLLKGNVFIISAPSGVGKSSLIKKIINIQNKFKISISYTTRIARPGEKNGKDYYFISKKKFKSMIKNKYFIEYAKVFGNYYGTSKTSIEKYLYKGINIFLEIDWQGARQIRKIIPANNISIFLIPPSTHEIYCRLLNRKQDNLLTINKRMKKFILEMMHYNEYDYLIINDKFSTALKNLNHIIIAENLKTKIQKEKYSSLIKILVS